MIDKKLATTLQRLVQFVLMCLSAIVVNAFISRWSLLIAMVIIFVFYVLQRFFRTSARELQRLESLSKGPVVSHLTETLSGLSTLRAFRQERPFLATMHEHIDAHTATVLVLNSTNRWLGFALVIRSIMKLFTAHPNKQNLIVYFRILWERQPFLLLCCCLYWSDVNRCLIQLLQELQNS